MKTIFDRSTPRRDVLCGKIMRVGSPVGRLVSRHTRELRRRYHAAGKLDSRIGVRVVEDDFRRAERR